MRLLFFLTATVIWGCDLDDRGKERERSPKASVQDGDSEQQTHTPAPSEELEPGEAIDPDPGSKPDDRSNEPMKAPGESDPVGSQLGKWARECGDIDVDRKDPDAPKTAIRGLTFENSTLSSFVDSFDKDGCTDKLYSSHLNFDYLASEQNDSYGKSLAIDATFRSRSLILWTDEAIRLANEASACGSSEWKKGESMELTTACEVPISATKSYRSVDVSSLIDKIYQSIKVLDNELYLATEKGTGYTESIKPGSRPQNFDASYLHLKVD